VVEQTFGTWKKQFPILVQPLEYSLDTQWKLVLALAVLHKLIIGNWGQSDFFADANYAGPAPEKDNIPDDNKDEDVSLSCAQEKDALNQWQDSLAQDMWDQYTQYLRQRSWSCIQSICWSW
jgi:hypothetical protein